MKHEYIDSIVFYAIPLEYNKKGYLDYDYYHSNKFILKRFTYPREIMKRKSHFFNLVGAKLQLLYPRYKVDRVFGSEIVDKRTKREIQKMKISSLKAQITKVENALENHKKERENTLFPNLENDKLYQRGLKKLKEKQDNLNKYLKSIENEQ